MLGDFASLDVQNTYRGSDAYGCLLVIWFLILALGLDCCWRAFYLLIIHIGYFGSMR
ncbi:hypothetical protein [Piscirickettsia salmonis]|uniref:hypothetical protein n=1 Tax=Piscirickettsia salmonis TaxID=1238 RepID=UPI000A9F06F3|nr:hypothetical protein [Piscirickettsia salmonis]QNR81310.1 hypothetical protein ICC15_04945 [Piscirickettsia salmonis]